ncbi:MAG: hypothetical protein F6J92_32415 [Symploca sp. SIO1A3]|nr:hypothetical protein [Symploca sp. SIO1A3]
MLDNIVKQTALALLVRAVRDPDPKVREELIRLFWDLQYIYRFGIPEIPNLIRNLDPTPTPTIPLPQPQPDPSPIDRLMIHEEILFGLIDIFKGDPSPDPNIAGVLRNTEIRLKAAKDLSQRLNTAMVGLNKEIESLQQQL